MVVITKGKPKRKRAASYCRTSGESQRDNTSIPTQKATNEAFIKANDWEFVGHYVDECKSGSKVAGRDDFQRMMKDAANNKFDIIVPADLTRYSRDGFDIMESSRTLARDFGVHVVDAKGTFDTRDHKRTVTNYVMAGVAEGDRLGILDRTIKGRIATAERGEQWYGSQAAPVGREYDEKANKHRINDKGRAILDICTRYLKGEHLTHLCKEYGISHKSQFSRWVQHSQLSGDYYATFNQPEVGIVDHRILVPGMPEVVPAKLLAKVKKRLLWNRTHNRTDAKQYLLQGFLKCGCCNKSLTGKNEKKKSETKVRTRYRHNGSTEQYAKCDFKSVLGRQVEGPILDYLYGRFLDEPAFNEAVQRAMPPASKRKKVEKQLALAVKQKKQAETEAKNLVDAIRMGAKVSLLLSAQMELVERIKILSERICQLESELADFPDEDEIKHSAMMVRLRLVQEYSQRDWRNLSQPEIKRFLLNLFGDSDGDSGIFVRRDENGSTIAEFKGRVKFDSFIADERPMTYAFAMEADRINAQLESGYLQDVAQIKRNYRRAMKRKGSYGKPSTATTSASTG